jgi:hypothetical protein
MLEVIIGTLKLLWLVYENQNMVQLLTQIPMSNCKAKGFFQLSNGFSLDKNHDHVIVVHTSDGRVASVELEGKFN